MPSVLAKYEYLMAISISHFALMRSYEKKIFPDRNILKNSIAIWLSHWNSCTMALHIIINFNLFWRQSKSISFLLIHFIPFLNIWTILSLFYLELSIPFLFALISIQNFLSLFYLGLSLFFFTFLSLFFLDIYFLCYSITFLFLLSYPFSFWTFISFAIL